MAINLADDIFKCIFLNENDRISIQISLNFVPSRPIYHNPALVQKRRQAITWTNDDPVRWRIYEALGGVKIYILHSYVYVCLIPCRMLNTF